MRSSRLGVAVIAGLAIAVNLLLVAARMNPRLILVASLCVLVGVALWLVYDMLDSAASTAGVPMARRMTPGPRTDRRVARLRSGLAFGRADDASFEMLRSTLIGLVDEQLRADHDLDLGVGMHRLRPVIGERLCRLVDDPNSALLLADPGQLERVLSDIEQL